MKEATREDFVGKKITCVCLEPYSPIRMVLAATATSEVLLVEIDGTSGYDGEAEVNAFMLSREEAMDNWSCGDCVATGVCTKEAWVANRQLRNEALAKSEEASERRRYEKLKARFEPEGQA